MNDDLAEPSTEPARLEMRGVSKRFGATRALHRVDLQVQPGEVLALVGENGAGKSTLMKVLSGAHAPDEGEMWLDGQPYKPRNPLDARRHGIAMIYQELSLAPHLSVMENILLGIEPTRGAVRPLERNEAPRRRGTGAGRLGQRPAGNAGAPTIARTAANGGNRPFGRTGKPCAGARRTHQQPHAQRYRPAFRADPLAAQAVEYRSFTFRISWKRSSRSAIGLPSCATASRSARESPLRHRSSGLSP